MLKKLKQKKVWIPLVILIFIVGYFIQNGNKKELTTVQYELVERRNIIHKVNANGKIQPEEEVQITSTITGWITQITVVEGDTVNTGQHLISIDEKQFRASYNQAASQVKSSGANLKKVKAQMERTNTLYSQKLISKQELEQVEAAFELALSQLEQAKASLFSREDELSKTQLLAPKYGIVTSLTKEEGEMAVGGMFNPGVLMTIADLSRMEVLVDVNENDVVTISVGDTAEIEIDAFPDTVFYGYVSEIAHTAQTMNLGSQEQVTNFKVKVKILSPPKAVRPGMSSTVNIITEKKKNTISIPIQSLTARPKNYKNIKKEEPKEKKWGNRRGNKSNNEKLSNKKEEPIEIVFILVDTFDGKEAKADEKYAVVQPVSVGVDSETHYSVSSGVKEGQLIVTGSYKAISREIQHGTLVSIDKQEDMAFEKE
ncbi:MAG: efflux RND transporter periplasmic adaptor subunit [Candidatus Marinimicrobia bacterium]|nr:efflux RND transporter periplasmic adaptor subunit [Candidatus Neomarinimicrobiota bacterium]